MMEWSKEELEQLKLHAGNYMSLKDIAVILEKDPFELLNEYRNKDSEVSRIIHAERLKVRSKIQKSIITSAVNGSNPAQVKILEIIQRINKTEL